MLLQFILCTLHGTSIHNNVIPSSSPLTVPLHFPFGDTSMLMSSCLLTISLNTPSTLLVYLNSTLQGEVHLPVEIPFGDNQLSFGDGMEKQPKDPLSLKNLIQKVEEGRFITLLSSVVILKGVLSSESLSALFDYSLSVINRSLLGPIYYQTGSLPSSFYGMNSLLSPERPLFEANAKQFFVHSRMDFTSQVLFDYRYER